MTHLLGAIGNGSDVSWDLTERGAILCKTLICKIVSEMCLWLGV
jgi:hypothetical protein